MDSENEEVLREAASVGNLKEISKLIDLGVNVNSVNKVNGWSALHWASKRGHTRVVEALLDAGADKNINNNKGELPADVTQKADIRELLGAPPVTVVEDAVRPQEDMEFKPNYLSNPGFIYSKADHHDDSSKLAVNHDQHSFHYQPEMVTCTAPSQWAPSGMVVVPQFIVLCVRLSHVSRMNNDFVEVEVNRQEAPTLFQLTKILCESLDMGINPEQVRNIRKLPHSALRTDRDVLRLTDYQALEIVLQPDALHPFDGSVISSASDSTTSPDSRYLKDHVSKLVY